MNLPILNRKNAIKTDAYDSEKQLQHSMRVRLPYRRLIVMEFLGKLRVYAYSAATRPGSTGMASTLSEIISPMAVLHLPQLNWQP